jgi:hypothetical protein
LALLKLHMSASTLLNAIPGPAASEITHPPSNNRLVVRAKNFRRAAT